MSDPDLIRLRADVEMIGTERLVKYAIAGGVTSSEAVDLIVAFGTLRYCKGRRGFVRCVEAEGGLVPAPPHRRDRRSGRGAGELKRLGNDPTVATTLRHNGRSDRDRKNRAHGA